MAVIHHTSMVPSKMELLAGWLPTRPWYSGPGRADALQPAGGFRLDDPDGEVGIEFMVVTDTGGAEPVTYHIPLGYRGSEIDSVAAGLIGTSEHGVLGKRWVYDGTRDPVVVNRMVALLAGGTQAQAQNDSNAPDRTVAVTAADLPAVGSALVSAAEGPLGTDIVVADGLLRVHRVLGRPGAEPVRRFGQVSVPWQALDGSVVRSVVLSELR
ncbi:maltokinase N-terminal cap-like domain-containing protein [Nocardia donostiensis]|uniref:1,4-alpha-glucan branching protein n=1 Tax=Nocardia donostiensis TaxID=1538463 RepID=A0A1W0BM23_9NOCA|nr:1,4-alpha-glucan branching protein [Nocardia donostiensis]ONM50108.1 1,4-alpha-glucan branching protein [Nocardia donostiensis]OQS15770.1 1,4-alpha-glucan branching protein [Nocardia donostiensis]OQS23575.1 1,4-alpha-glucan branching protein [Nocardia donostiensis]